MIDKVDGLVVANRRANLNKICKDSYGTKRALARRIGYAEQYVGGLINGSKSFGDDVARSIESSLNLPAGYLDESREPIRPVAAPEENSAALARLDISRLQYVGGEAVLSNDFIDALQVRSPWLFSQPVSTRNPNALRIATAPGDEMDPTIGRGDIVLIDISQDHIVSNGIYAISVAKALSLCRIQILPDESVVCKFDNPHYDTSAPLPADRIKVVGRCLLAFNINAL